MARQKQDIILSGMCENGKVKLDEPHQETRFSNVNDGKRVMVSYQLLGDLSNKSKMFKFLHGPLCQCLQNAMEDTGQGIASTDSWYRAMKRRYGMKPWYNPDTKKEEAIEIDYASDSVSSVELRDFIERIILFLETEVGVETPDSSEFLMKKRLGPTKKSFNNKESF